MPDMRMPDLNRVTLAGNLTRDPELKHVGTNETALCKLGLAVNRKYKMKNGEQKEETLFIEITVWGKAAEYAAEHLQKGRAVLVEGRLKSDEWEDKDSGKKRSRIEVNADRIQSLSWDEKSGGEADSREAPPF